MAKITSTSPFDAKIVSVEITSDRFPTAFEIVNNVTEINIYENIDRAYLTASIMIADSSNLLEQIGFRGTEKVKISLKINGDDRSAVTTKRFVVVNIESVAPINDVSEGLSLNLIEEHAYVSRLTSLSKSYRGKPEQIIATMLFDTLGIRIDQSNDASVSSAPPMQVIIPSITPLKAARWIRNRIVTSNGSPYYLYATLNNENLFLSDLDFLLQQNPINLNRPYVFGQAFMQEATTRGIDEQARVIQSYRLQKSENMLQLAVDGILNAKHEYIDTLREKDPREEQVEIDLETVITNLKERGILSREQSIPIYDNQFTINDKKLREYNTAPIHQIVTSNTFENYSNYYESTDVDQQKLRAYSRALRYYLLKSPMEITMPGWDFLGRGPDITIGRQIRLHFLKNDPDLGQRPGDTVLDPKRSGDYIVYTMRHIIQPEKYTVSMAVAKLGDRNV